MVEDFQVYWTALTIILLAPVVQEALITTKVEQGEEEMVKELTEVKVEVAEVLQPEQEVLHVLPG